MYQTNKSYFLLLLVILFWPVNLQAHKTGIAYHQVKAYCISQESTPVIDGQLNDQVWKLAEPINNFVQIRPSREQPATEDTEVRILYDKYNLYIGVRCYDSAPEKIVNRLTRRDQMWSSDNISFFIDPYHDHRTGYKFATTPAGVQNDDYRYEDVRRDKNWRGIWWVETSIDTQGWVAELKIPFANFRFEESDQQIWGFDIERVHRRKGEVTVWHQLTQAGPLTRMSDLGHLVGLKKIQGGKQFEVAPYLLAGVTRREHRFTTGIDMQYNLAGSLKTNLTLNPDFAQIEADQLEINLSRYPTRFPERRPFFVEGNSFFDTPLDLFFSRRVGNLGDILWGAKMTGKIGPYSIGVLSSQTGNFALSSISSLNKDKDTKKESAFYSAIRTKRDILKRSNFGLLVATKEKENSYSRVGGLDMNLALGSTYLVSGQIAQSFNTQPPVSTHHMNSATENRAYILRISQRNYLWSTALTAKRIEPNFEINQTGYLRKENNRGSQGLYLDGNYLPPVGLHRLSLGFETGLYRTLYDERYFTNWVINNPQLSLAQNFEDDALAWDIRARCGIDFSESVWDTIGISYAKYKSVELTEMYVGDQFGLSLETSNAYSVAGYADMVYGDYYNFARQNVGIKKQVSLGTVWRPVSNMSCELDSSYAQSLQSTGKIDGRFFAGSFRLTYLFRRNLFGRIFTQLGHNRTNHYQIETEKNYLVSFLLGWEYTPKSHLFLAYNEDWNATEKVRKLDNRVIVLKLSYLWNL